MKRHARWVLPATLTVIAGVLALGCSESNDLPVGGGAVGSTAAGISAPQGPFPRGNPTGAYAIDPATVGPVISIVSPSRAAQVTGTTVEVRLKVDDPDGVTSVNVLGSPALSQGSDYVAQVSLVSGQNLIDVEATDGLGNRTTSYVSVVQGQFQPDDQLLSHSVGVSLTQPGLDRVADIAEQETTTLNLGSLLLGAGPLVDNFFIKITANGLVHDPMQFQAAGTATGAEVVVDLDNVALDLTVDPVALGATQAIITADRVSLTAQAIVSQSAFTGGGLVNKRALGLEITQIDINFQNYALRTSSGALNVVLLPFQNIIENAVRNMLKDLLVDVINDELSKNLVALDLPLGISIPNPIDPAAPTMDLDFMFQIDEASGAANVGLGVAGGLRVTPTTPAPGVTRNVLVSGATVAPAVTGPEKFGVMLTADAANSFLHALYATGALQIELDGSQPQAIAGLSVPLNAGMLYPFLPQVRELAPDPRTPIVISAALGSAPLVSLGQDPAAPFAASIGEIEVRVLIDYMDGGPRQELFTLNVAADARAQVIIQNNEIIISNLDVSRTRVDITSEPAVDLADQEIEDFMIHLMPTIQNQFLGQIPAIPIPGLPLGLALTNARVDVQPGKLSLHGDL